VGQRVAAGARIATVGATGLATTPHLHYEVRVRGEAVDPLRVTRR
jgi:murein DD-endopeptidase MepM/ murein hydrolase activator NlpD